MTTKKLYFTLLLLIAITACETIVDVDLPKTKPLIVVNGICNPGKPWEINISKSKDILDNENTEAIRNANIEILEGMNSIGTFRHIKDGTYKIGNIEPKVNTNYQLKVSADGFETVTSTCTVPQPVKITNIKLDTVKKTDPEDYGMSDINLEITFTDPPNESNYYSIIILQQYNDDSLNQSPVWFQSNDLLIEKDGDVDIFDDNDKTFRGNTAYFTDDVINGKTYTMSLTYQYWEGEVSQHFYIVLNTLSEDYYKYLKTLKSQRRTKDNPFAEPVIVYNNIQNGLGIFAGYSSLKYKLY